MRGPDPKKHLTGLNYLRSFPFVDLLTLINASNEAVEGGIKCFYFLTVILTESSMLIHDKKV